MDPSAEAPVHYRIVLDNVLGTGAAAWFEEAVLHAAGEQTVLDVVVADQAALHGILRRIHDLHLKLVSVARIDLPEPTSDPNTSP